MIGSEPRRVRYLLQEGAVKKVMLGQDFSYEIDTDYYEKELDTNATDHDSKKWSWTKLNPIECLSLSVTDYFYKKLNSVETAIHTAKYYFRILPMMFCEVRQGIRCFPWLVFGDKKPVPHEIKDRSEIGFEFFRTADVPPIEVNKYAAEFTIKHRRMMFDCEKITDKNLNFVFHDVAGLFFSLLEKLEFDLKDIAPHILWEIGSPHIHYTNVDKIGFNDQFSKFASDIDKIQEYLNKK